MRYRALLPKMTDLTEVMRLFCLPHAGGGAAAFYRASQTLPRWLQIVPLALPGRESRISDPPYHTIRELAGDAADALWPYIDQPYGVLGYSLGALASFELLNELRRRGGPMPKLFVPAACRSPQFVEQRSPIHALPEDQFLHEIETRYNGVPPAVRENRELLDLVLPTLRADVRLLETYDFRPQPPLEVDMLALGGTSDAAISPTHLNAWREHTSARFSTRLLPGGHFFLFDDTHGGSKAAWDVIVNRLAIHRLN